MIIQLILLAPSYGAKNTKKFVRQEAMEKDETSTCNGSCKLRCEIKITSDDEEIISQSAATDSKEDFINHECTNEEDWSSTKQNTESGSEDNFSLMPDSDLSRSSEATSDQDSVSSDIYVGSEQEEFAINQVELGNGYCCPFY